MNIRDVIGKVLMGLGVILVVSAVGLIGYNTYVENQADQYSAEVVYSIQEEIEQNEVEEIQEVEGQLEEIEEIEEVESVTVGDSAYIGILEIPQLSLELPVASTFSYTQLNKTPCAYLGSIEGNNLVIAGHNYAVHFKYLKNLALGDVITLTDVNGTVYEYEVIEKEIVAEEEIEALEVECDLTLFTCNTNNTQRVVVRFNKLPLQNII